ncbi:MAG: hypothetical protein IKG46_09370 [Solobacterium sp.]|nr:hypothetical protein [Solobacterium sp.]
MAVVMIGTVSRWLTAKQISEELKKEGITVLAIPEDGLKEPRILRTAVMWSSHIDLFVGLWDEDTDIVGEGEPLLRRIVSGDGKRILDLFPEDDPEEQEHILNRIRDILKK